MIGKRKDCDEDGHLNLAPGEYGKDRNGNWYCCTPNEHMGNLREHDVTEHEDETITVSPSILVSDQTGELWHGYLEKGVWREC